MISVFTLTYKRPHLLEEAIQSFLLQDLPDAELIIVNDNPDSDYIIDHPNVKMINYKGGRFSSISKKFEWGIQHCKYDYIFRLDDDDLLSPTALIDIYVAIQEEQGEFDIFKHPNMYYLKHNIHRGIRPGVNTGITYKKSFLEGVEFKDLNFGEDRDLLYNQGATICDLKCDPVMFYRWGMNTIHMSGFGDIPAEEVNKRTDKMLIDEKGRIELNPQFLHDYYNML